jgi:F-type H+-transporting ATPase subunit b
MPQFDPSSFASQLFWLVVTFVALYWVVAKIGIPRISEVLDQRARVIQDDLDRAAQLKTETDQAIEIYEAAMTAARDQAHEHMRTIQAEMKSVAEARTAELSAKVTKQIGEAETRINTAKQAAMDGLTSIAADAARDVVRKLAELSPDGGVVDAAVAQALKESR